VSDDQPEVVHFWDLRYEVDQATQRYADLLAERDRLQEDRDDWRNIADDVNAELADTKIERDRLRAVVDAVREVCRLREAAREVDEPANWNDEAEVKAMSQRLAGATVATSDALDAMSDLLDQLDGSPTMGGDGV